MSYQAKVGVPQVERPSDYTARILKHYLRMALEASGRPWDADYAAEIDGAVDPIRTLELKVENLEMAVAQLMESQT